MNDAAFARLDALPRERLGLLPTPLAEAPALARAIGLPALWIKRDELIGFGFGGNKVRGLELLIGDARARGADVVVTGAGAQSNHVRATAAAAAHAGMQAIAAYWGEEPAAVQGNLRLTRLLGAQIRFTNNADRAQVDQAINHIAAEQRAAGRRPYPIPRGGACALGVLGWLFCIWSGRIDGSCQIQNNHALRVLAALVMALRNPNYFVQILTALQPK